MSKNRLGKGLGALIVDNKDNGDYQDKISNIFVEKIEPNPFQPRQEFDREALQELSESIKENGVIQPVTVRKVEPGKYQLVTGERRWRACRLIDFREIPALIKDYSDFQMMEIALIENLQREDLNPIEEAQAYQKMIDEFNMTQEQVAQKVGKSRSSVANAVRLLKLAPKIQVYVSRETLSMGHARALLSLKKTELQISVADYVIDKGLSVRETEKHINNVKNKKNKKDNKEKKNDSQLKESLSPRWIKAREELSHRLGTDIKIKNYKNKKVVSIECEQYKDIEKIIDRIE